MYFETDLLPLSALQHFQYCPRQCALIHLEQTWAENRFTAEGRILHEKVDSGWRETRGDITRTSAMPLRSFRLGIIGKADSVEFHQDPGGTSTPYPVEYKRGRKKSEPWDKVQLCAQAICLEEMLNCPVPEGALFYGKNRRRERVLFDDALRTLTEDTAKSLHAMISDRRTPRPVPSERCTHCSLKEICRPDAARKRLKVTAYITAALNEQCENI